MSPSTRSYNLAARMGRWSASHWKTAVFGWLAFVVAALAIGMQVGTKQIDMQDANVGQSHKADQILKEGFPQAQADPQKEFALVQSSTRTVNDPAFRATVNDVVGAVKGNPAIKNLKSPLDPKNRDQVSTNRRTAIVTWNMKGTPDAAKTKIDSIEASITKVGDRHPAFYVGEAGSVSSGKALDKMFVDQLKTAGERSIPITILVLLLVFGALVAVGVPLLLALSGVAATIGLAALPSQLVPLDKNVSAVILLIGLAVGVDYSLFYLKREREERAAGKSSRAAIEAAAATSGRSVLISGLTVMIAMAGMLLFPLLGRLRRDRGENRFWKAILKPALRRPAIAATVAGAALIVMALPTLDMHTTRSGLDALPNSAPTVPTIKKIQTSFSNGEAAQSEVAIKANIDSPATQKAIAALKARTIAEGVNSGSIDELTSKSTRRIRSHASTSRSSARAPTRGQTRRCASSATRSCPRRSAR